MKKIFTLFLILGLVMTLFACNNSNSGSENSESPSETTSAQLDDPDTEDTYTPGYTTTGWYDPDGDYYNRDPYKIVYITYDCGSFGAQMSDNFKGWASITNVDYSTVDSADMDQFYNLLEVYVGQGYDGFILDGDPSTAERTVELTNELGVTAWSTAVSPLRNADGTMMWAGVSMDSKGSGYELAEWLFTNYPANFGNDVDINDIGYIHVDYSVVPNVHVMVEGIEEFFATTDFNMENYFVVDAAGQSFEAETGYNLVSTTISSNSDIDYWLISTLCEPYGAGAASAVESIGKTKENALVASQDGTTLFTQWDAGYDGCWAAALTCPMEFFTEPIMLGVIAMIDGTATSETLWPDYLSEGETYPNLVVANTMLTVDNYSEFLADLKERAPFEVEG